MASANKRKSTASRGRKKTTKKQSAPIRREIGATVCGLLALLTILCCFKVNAAFLDLMTSVFRGLIGAGFYILPFSFIMSFLILILHDGRPVALRVTCTFLTAMLIGSLVQLVGGKFDADWDWSVISALWDGGIDGTAGGAGHSRQIALRLDGAKGGRLVSLDQDPDAVQTARARLAGLPATVVQINFRYAGQALESLGIEKINGALLDLGVSSHQLDDAARGFSYRADAPLDMRMSQQGETAADLVNTASREEISRILRDYGEEPYAWQIAGHIVEARETAPIETTLQLADIVASAMPPAERRKNKNPSRRTFQALRIAVNHELDALEEGLDTIFDHLAPGGRLCVITFHSLEDRLVKNKFRRWSTACTCPPEFPVCVCGGKAKAKLITRKPIEADKQELEENRRSRSAHLRVLEKL